MKVIWSFIQVGFIFHENEDKKKTSFDREGVDFSRQEHKNMECGNIKNGEIEKADNI